MTPTTSAPTRRRLTEATEVVHGDRSNPQVALTFHGNGDPSLAAQLLRLVEKSEVKVTVFAVGTWLTAHPLVARRILAAGHDLGNHTLHHHPMRQLSAEQAYAEIVGCASELHKVAGTIGTWFRASGTQRTTTTIRRSAVRAGYARCISYDVDGLDWRDPSAAVVTDAVLSGTRNGSIISLHLGHPVTVEAIPAILHGLRAKHLQPVTLTQLLA